jgi:hypothetical protein
MKKTIFRLSSLLFTAAFLMIVISCSKNETVTFSLSSLKAGDIDLNLSTPATGVPTNPTIIAGFTVNVDAASVTATTVTLLSQIDSKTVELTLTTSGSAITIVPKTILGTGSVYTLTITGIKSTDNQVLTSVVRSFTTEGAYAPGDPIAYWNFENNANDVMGTFNPMTGGIIDITYVDSYKSIAGKAASFNGTTSLIRIPNGNLLDSTADFSLAFWVKSDSSHHGQFVMGLAGWYGFQFEIEHGDDNNKGWCKLAAQYRYADNTSGSEDLWFNGDGKTKDNGGWQGWTFCKDLKDNGSNVNAYIADKWCFVTCVYDATSKVGTLYLNGEKMKAQDFNLWPAGDPKLTVTGLKYNGAAGNNTFVFGFIQDFAAPTIPDDWANYNITTNNHFKGLLDDVRIYHRPLTPTEIAAMYASAQP